MLIRTIMTTVLTAALALPALAEGDPEAGAKVFNKCKACHAVGADAKNKVGPVLTGIIGAPAGANPEFKYSDVLLARAADGLVWDEANLTEYLTKPSDFMKGTKMSFAGLRKEEDVKNVLAYIASYQ
jgi:cytochrome c